MADFKTAVRGKALKETMGALQLHNGRIRVMANDVHSTGISKSNNGQDQKVVDMIKEDDAFIAPATSFELWDSHAIGNVVIINGEDFDFSSVQMHLCAYKAWRQPDTDSTSSITATGSFIGRLLLIHPADRFKTLVLDRFDSFFSSTPRPYEIVMENDVPMQVTMDKDPSLERIGTFIRVAISKRNTLKMQVIYNYVPVLFECTPVRPSRIKHSVLTQSLLDKETRNGLSSSCGYVAIDNARAVTLLHDEDPSLEKLPLHGIWISNNGESLQSFKTFTAICKLFTFDGFKKTSFLLITFPRDCSRPCFYDVTVKGTVDMKCKKSLVIESNLKSNISRPLIFEMNEKRSVTSSSSPKNSYLFKTPQPVSKPKIAVTSTPKTPIAPVEAKIKKMTPQPKADIPLIPAQQYLQMLKEQIEFVTKHLGIDLNEMPKSNATPNPPSPTKILQNTGTNTSTVLESSSKCEKKDTISAIVQTTFSNLDAAEGNANPGQFVPLYNDFDNDMQQNYDEDERKFIANIPDLNGEGYTSISMKMEASEPVRSPLKPLDTNMEMLLKNVDDALRNKTFEASSSMAKSKNVYDSIDRRHSFPLSKQATPGIPLVAHKLEDISDAEKSFILLELSSCSIKHSDGDDQNAIDQHNNHNHIMEKVRPPLFREEQKKEPTTPLKQTISKLKSMEISSPASSSASLKSSLIVGTPGKKKKNQRISADVSSILDDSIGNNSIESIHNLSMGGNSSDPTTDATTYEGFSFATLEYLKRYRLM